MKSNQPDVSEIKWLEVAIASEKTALNNYLDYASQTRDKSGKDMFIKLARDEFHHMAILETEKERLQTGRAWQAVKIPLSPIEQIFPLVAKNRPIPQEVAQSDESHALELAMKAEKKAMEFYQTRAKKAESAPARALLERLAQMEDAHYKILQAELDNINKTGFWMGFREISTEAE